MASKTQDATVTIDRAARTFEVRCLRRRRVYVLPLDAVAERVVRGIIFAEVMEAKRQKAAKKRLRRRAA
jgi:hypothetical protein